MSLGRKHPLEAAVEWLAPIPLALAAGWASWRLGVTAGGAAGLGVAVLVVGLVALRKVGASGAIPVPAFQPAEFEAIEPDELILEEQDSVLELEDRLEDIGPDSRVVRLFDQPEPTPGELVDRITAFLGEGRPAAAFQPQNPGDNIMPDASAALHDALASIRASLR